MITKVILQVQ